MADFVMAKIARACVGAIGLLYTAPVLFHKITIAGVGLLGGSLGLAIKRRGLARTVDGLVRRTASIGECEQLGVVDHATRDAPRAAAGADLILLCSSVSRMRELTEAMRPGFKPGVIVTDVGSVKASVSGELEPIVTAGGGHFVGSHPMAGAEKSGPGAASADLFEQAMCVVTPTARSSTVAVGKVEAFWKAVGGTVMRMSPEAHDDLVSRSSHLPHVVAAGLANYVLSPAHPKEQAQLCATGFRDTTRIASGLPEMWREIALANRVNLARVLGVFIADLEDFKHALDEGDAKGIQEFLETAKRRRDDWLRHPVSPSSE
jgi:prephenate dehydrogenase